MSDSIRVPSILIFFIPRQIEIWDKVQKKGHGVENGAGLGAWVVGTIRAASIRSIHTKTRSTSRNTVQQMGRASVQNWTGQG